MHKQAWHAATLLLLAATNLNCSAGQRKEVRDGIAVEALISEREATRIRVEDAMITGVVGKIQLASGCNVSAESPQAAVQAPMQPSNPMAEASITCDLAKGEIYLRPFGTEKNQSICSYRRTGPPTPLFCAGPTCHPTPSSCSTHPHLGRLLVRTDRARSQPAMSKASSRC